MLDDAINTKTLCIDVPPKAQRTGLSRIIFWIICVYLKYFNHNLSNMLRPQGNKKIFHAQLS